MGKKYLDEENIRNKGTLTENEGIGEVEILKGFLGPEIAKENEELREDIFNLLNKVYPEKEFLFLNLLKINDHIDGLITLLHEVSENNRPFVESKIKEVLEEKLKTIYDRSNLISMLGKVPEKFKPLVESRISDCFKEETIRFSNEDTLKSVVTNLVSSMERGEVYISTEVDKAIYDYFNNLVVIERISNLSKVKKTDTKIVEEVFKNELSKIWNKVILVTILKKVPEKFKPLVESRIIEIFKFKVETRKRIKAEIENG